MTAAMAASEPLARKEQAVEFVLCAEHSAAAQRQQVVVSRSQVEHQRSMPPSRPRDPSPHVRRVRRVIMRAGPGASGGGGCTGRGAGRSAGGRHVMGNGLNERSAAGVAAR